MTAAKPMTVDTLRRLMAEVGKPAERWQRLYEAEAQGRWMGVLLRLRLELAADR